MDMFLSHTDSPAHLEAFIGKALNYYGAEIAMGVALDTVVLGVI